MPSAYSRKARSQRRKRESNSPAKQDAFDVPSTSPTGTVMSPPQTAVARVFGIVELLELILLKVAEPEDDGLPFFAVLPEGPAEQLFAVQRVSQNFRNVVDDSIRLRRRMCLAPYPADQKCDPSDLPRWFAYHQHNLIKHHQCLQMRWHHGRLASSLAYGYFVDPPINHPQQDSAAAERWLRPEASWRRMRVYPTREHSGHNLTVYVLDKTLVYTTRESEGITMGQIRELFAQLTREMQRYHVAMRPVNHLLEFVYTAPSRLVNGVHSTTGMDLAWQQITDQRVFTDRRFFALATYHKIAPLYLKSSDSGV